VDWVEAILAGESPEACRVLASAWTNRSSGSAPASRPENIIQFPEPELSLRAAEESATYGLQAKSRPLNGTLDFQVFDSPASMEAALRCRLGEGNSARILAPYARPWKTRPTRNGTRDGNPHDLPPQLKDIVIPYQQDDETKTWAKIWNFVPRNGSDYSVYIQGREGSRMHTDPLCEVGCPYTVRGFDWDYVGILWFSDLVRLEARWFADPKHIHETGFSTLTSKARNERDPDGLHHRNLREAVAQCYRILLTRPIRGIYLWFEDKATQKYVESAI